MLLATNFKGKSILLENIEAIWTRRFKIKAKMENICHCVSLTSLLRSRVIHVCRKSAFQLGFLRSKAHFFSGNPSLNLRYTETNPQLLGSFPADGSKTGFRRIFADVIVYIFAHLHTSKPIEDVVVCTKKIQKLKQLLILSSLCNFQLIVINNKGNRSYQKLRTRWVAKTQMTSHILCKHLSF